MATQIQLLMDVVPVVLLILTMLAMEVQFPLLTLVLSVPLMEDHNLLINLLEKSDEVMEENILQKLEMMGILILQLMDVPQLEQLTLDIIVQEELLHLLTHELHVQVLNLQIH